MTALRWLLLRGTVYLMVIMGAATLYLVGAIVFMLYQLS